MIGNEDTIAWLAPHIAVVRYHGEAESVHDDAESVHFWGEFDESCGFYCSADDGEDIVAVACSPEHSFEICDVVVRLLAVSVVHSVTLSNQTRPYEILIDALTLALLMEQCQSLKFLSLGNLEMDENHCRVLGAYSRPGLEIVLNGCVLTDTGASALAEVLGRNQGPTKLNFCLIDNFVLANGLRGNSSLNSLAPNLNRGVGGQELLAIAGALQENKGLVDLDLCHGLNAIDEMTDETWDAVCDYLKTHPTLEVLDFRARFRDAMMTPAKLKSRIQALVDMLKVNTSIHTIHLRDLYSEHELFRESVSPYLETNRFRPRLLAIQRARPVPYRAKVLGRALMAARADANCFWMLLSGNAEVAFPSSTTTISAAANLPTPATVGATSNATFSVAATAAISAAVTITSTRTASTTASSTAANVATPTACQKRKARP
jgi:hypothetical protein